VYKITISFRSSTDQIWSRETKIYKVYLVKRVTGVQMVEFKAIVNDVKTGRSYNVTVSGHHANSLNGKSIGEIVDGIFVGLPGYKLKITGGSDGNGTPMRADLPGNKRRNLLLSDGLGFKEIYKGERRRVAIRGSVISNEIVQVNLAIAEYGPKSVEESFAPPQEGAAEEH